MTTKFQSGPNGVCASRFHNDEFASVIVECLRLAKEQFGGAFLSVEARQWEEDYGDVLPDGYVMVKPFSRKPA